MNVGDGCEGRGSPNSNRELVDDWRVRWESKREERNDNDGKTQREDNKTAQ